MDQKSYSKKTAQIIAQAAIISLVTTGVARALPSFPEAEGYGAVATGGRGGDVYHVTNLNDSGTGSLRAGFSGVPASGRTIVFDVGGWIELASTLPAASNVTIAGQTAPGQGIGLKNYGFSVSNKTNVVARYLRLRQGPYMDAVDKDASGGDSATNIMFDHISASWGRDETMSFNSSTNVTVQNSIIAEGMYNHSMGSLMQWNNGLSIHHSIYMNNNDRNPKAKGIMDFVNNVVYNWGAYAYVGESAGLSYGNVVGNYFIAGPSSTELHDPISRGNANYSMYMDGNLWDGNRNGILDGHILTQAEVDDPLTWMSQRFNYPLVNTDTAQRAYEKVLAGAGASISRDYTDNRLINQIQTQTGAIISDPAQVGGWGTLTGGVAPTDTDQDGMPNSWETAHGMNPNDAADRNNLNLFGYTRLEEYLNELGGGHATRTMAGSGKVWSTATDWNEGSIPKDDNNVYIRGSGGVNGYANLNSAAEAWNVRIGGDGAVGGEQLVLTTGAALNVKNDLTVGYENNGRLVMMGGDATAAHVVLGTFAYQGTLQLDGGTLHTTMIAPDGAGGTIQMNGGTIAASAALAVSAPITLNLNGGTIDTAGNSATISSVISGFGALRKTGAGDLMLTDTNTYSGGTVLTGGTLSISDHNQIGGSTSAITFNGGMLRVTGTGIPSIGTHTVNWATFNGGFDIADSTHTFVITSAIGGTGSLTKAGAGTMVLQNASTYTGGTTVSGGVLSAQFDQYLGSTNGALNLAGGTLRITSPSPQTVARPTILTNSSTIDLTQSTAVVTMSQPITGTGAMNKIGLGTLILGAANTYTGQTTVTAGTLKITNASALQNTTLNLAGGTIDLNNLAATVGGLAGTGTVDIKGTKLTLGSNGADSTFAGTIINTVGSGSVEKVGTNAIDLTGTNTYSNGTTLTSGTLGITSDANIGQLANSSITFNGGLLRINGTTLTSMGSHVVNWSTFNGGFDIANSANTFTVSSNISGSGTMTVAGSGILVLSGSNSYTGGTILKGGELSITSPVNFGGSTKAITFAGGILRTVGTSPTDINLATVNWSTFNGGFDISTSGALFTVSSVIGGTGSLTKLGAGILYLSAANTFSGDTTLTAGTLRIGNINALQNSNLVPNGGTLALQTITSANVGGLKGSGALSLTGVTLNVGSNNQSSSYSGVLSSTTGGVLNKQGTGTLTLSGASTFAGPINIQNGVISVASFANASTNSPLGFGASASGLVIDGGLLQYNSASAATSTRLFSIGPNGGTIECAGAGKLLLQGTGSIGMTGTGDRTFTLAGVNADCELKSAVGDPTTGKTTLNKIDGGRWILSQTAAFTYSGDTIIDQGILIPLSISNILPHGTGKGNLVLNEGQFELNNFNLTVNALIGGGNINQRGKSSSTDVTRTITVGDANSSGEYYGTLSNTSGLNAAAKLSFAKIGSGTQILSGRNTYTGATTVSAGKLIVNGTHDTLHDAYTVSGGSLEVNGSISALSTLASLTVTGSGTVTVNSTGAFRTSTINSSTTITNNGLLSSTSGGSIPGITGSGTLQTSGATLTVATGVRQDQISISNSSGITIAAAGNAIGVTKVKSINIQGNGSGGYLGKLNLQDNDLVVDYTGSASSYSAVVDMVKNGLQTLGGDGYGISSQQVDAQTIQGTMLAVVDNGAIGGQITSTSGFSTPTNSVIVKYTWFGDSNLDGKVDGSDYALIDSGFTSGGTLGGWLFGDYDYGGTVDGSDYALIDTGFISQSGVLPEPACVALLGFVAFVAHRRVRLFQRV